MLPVDQGSPVLAHNPEFELPLITVTRNGAPNLSVLIE